MKKDVITKAEASRRWGVSKPMVTRYLHLGLPELPDGKLDWAVATLWRKANVISERSGNHYARTQRLGNAKAVIDALNQSGVAILVKICRGLGLTNLQTHAAFNAMTVWVDATVGEPTMSALYPDDMGPQLDYEALRTVKLTKAESDELDAIVDRISTALDGGSPR